jgi:hypothetical protein
MRGKKRPLSERTRAVGIALVDGVKVASEATGIPERTIDDWRSSDEFAELRDRTREAATDELWAIVQKGFRRVGELIPASSDLQKVSIATAIVADKMLLLRGEATNRYEATDLTKEFDDHELDLLRDAIEREDTVRSAEEAAVVGLSAEESTTSAR